MKTYQFLPIVLFFFISNCAEERRPVEQETPEVLDANFDGYDLLSSSRKYKSDILGDLYFEALEKNKELKALANKMNTTGKNKREWESDFNNYLSTNQSYWAAVDTATKQFKDTSLQQYITPIFDQLEKEYHAQLSNHHEKLEELAKKASNLQDQQLLMKIAVTQPMMKNYQLNELPDIEKLQGLIKEYEALIEATKPFATINK